MSGAVHLVSTPASGLALEAELLAQRTSGALLWASQTRALVVPESVSRKPGFESAAQHMAGHGWPVVLRPTGGGAVPQSPGVLNLALAADVSRGFSIEDGYRLLTGPILAVLARHEIRPVEGKTPGSFCDGAWNLSIAGRKFVGTAQRWRPLRTGGARVLLHAMILMHGRIGPATTAVNAFQAQLNLGPTVRAESHTTLESVLCGTPADVMAALEPLHEAGLRNLRQWQRGIRGRAAA